MSSLTSDQAAFMLHTLGLPALKAEHSMTSAVNAAITPERGDYRPHADSRNAFDLAWHIVSTEIKYLDAIAAGVFPHDLKPVPDDARGPSEVLAWYSERFDPAAPISAGTPVWSRNVWVFEETRFSTSVITFSPTCT